MIRKSIYLRSKVIKCFRCTRIKESRELVCLKINKEVTCIFKTRECVGSSRRMLVMHVEDSVQLSIEKGSQVVFQFQE